jgi:hypothetical protein
MSRSSSVFFLHRLSFCRAYYDPLHLSPYKGDDKVRNAFTHLSYLFCFVSINSRLVVHTTIRVHKAHDCYSMRRFLSCFQATPPPAEVVAACGAVNADARISQIIVSQVGDGAKVTERKP